MDFINELTRQRDQADRELAEATRALSEASKRLARARKEREAVVRRLIEAREVEFRPIG